MASDRALLQRLLNSVFFLGDVGAVENGVGLMAAGLTQELVVNPLDIGVLMATADRHIFILPVKRCGAEGADVGEIAYIGVLDRLAASVNAAAGATHNFDEIILEGAASDAVKHLFGIGAVSYTHLTLPTT